MFTKKYTLSISTVLVIVLFAWDYIGNYKLCGSHGWGGCVDTMANSETLLVPFIGVFLFSLLSYKMRDEVYHTWFRFARWWIPLSMLLIFISPEYTNDLIIPIVKGTVAFATSLIFAIISLIIIAWKYFATQKKM